MEVLSEFSFFPVEFNRDGAVVDRGQVDALLSYLAAQQQSGTGVTDLIVLSHGWNNDMNDAHLLYTRVLAVARAVLTSGKIPALTGRNFAVMGVFWPSKRFADSQVISGGAAGFGDSDAAAQDQLAAQIDALSAAIGTPAAAHLLGQAKGLLPDLTDRASARRQFADLIRAALQRDPGRPGDGSEDGDAVFFALDGEDLFQKLQMPPGAAAPSQADTGGAAGMIEDGVDANPDASGGAAGLGDFFGNVFGSITAATQNLLNVSTYYEMKARSGMVGKTGVYTTLREIAAASPELRMHLIGHSFGGRLVTSVAMGPQGGAPLPISSMTLLQAAYSHNGLGVDYDGAGHNGGFRGVIAEARVRGPIAISFSVHDKAVGTAYPLASRISDDNADALGDAQDIFGGMGRNGAQHTPEAAFLTMQPVGGGYDFRAGGVYNLNSDAIIQEHSDLAHEEVAYAFLSAAAAGGSFPVRPASGPGVGGGSAAAGPTGAGGTSGTAGGTSVEQDVPSDAAGISNASTAENTPFTAGAASLLDGAESSSAEAASFAGAASSSAETTASAATPVAPSVDATSRAALSAVMTAPRDSPFRILPGHQERIQSNLDSAVVANSLRKKIESLRAQQSWSGSPRDDEIVLDVIIDVNQNYSGTESPAARLAGGSPSSPAAIPVSSRESAKNRVRQLLQEILVNTIGQGIYERKCRLSHQYLFARLSVSTIFELVRRDNDTQPTRRSDATIEAAGNAAASVSNSTVARTAPPHHSVYRVWEDFEVDPLLTHSITTIKANAAHAAFGALGKGIVWAVMDSGIDAKHRHFSAYANLDLPAPLRHTDFSRLNDPPNATPQTLPTLRNGDEEQINAGQALTDAFGHGTHVAGIIAGMLTGPSSDAATVGAATSNTQGAEVKAPTEKIVAVARQHSESGDVDYVPIPIDSITGIAPQCKLLSLKVLDDGGRGQASSIIAGIDYIQEVNGHGRRIVIHGVNLSVGYGFDPEWFACGQSPLCAEVDRLVKSGVVVVIAAGNTGYGFTNTQDRGAVAAGLPLSINDPGNAELAITVGSTHRDMPHIYGVSYFSSKGPTGDGRLKPDIVAPGEKILSCAAGQIKAHAVAGLRRNAASQPAPAAAISASDSASAAPTTGGSGTTSEPVIASATDPSGDDDPRCDYVEQSGTSMAAPHVSGAVAAFLSVRREYIGQPDLVKQIFTSSATDLGRQRDFQGHGLLDLMRAMQAV